MSREFLWERLEPRALRPIIRDPPAKSSRLKPLPREPGLPRGRRLQLLQALDRRIQRRFVLGETQPHQALARGRAFVERRQRDRGRSEEHTSELQSLMRISYAVFCLKKKKNTTHDY